MDPVISRSTRGAMIGSSLVRSRVTMARWDCWDSRSIRPWPISPPAPVMRTTGFRTSEKYSGGRRRSARSDDGDDLGKDGQDRREDRDARKEHQGGGDEEVVHALALQGIEPHSGQVAAD